MNLTKLTCVWILLTLFAATGIANAGNGGYNTGDSCYWRNNHDLNFDTSAPTEGYAKNPDQIYATQLKQAQTGLSVPVIYPTVTNVAYVQPTAQPYYQVSNNVVPVNFAQQGYTQQYQQQVPYYAYPQSAGVPVYADAYHAQMEAKARELNLKRTDLAINNVDRQEKANDRAETRDKNYTVRDTFHTVNSGVSTVSNIRNFVRGW